MRQFIKPLSSLDISEQATKAILSEAMKSLRSEEEAQTLWTPLPGPQTDAYDSEADEVFYGGSAGGGKTDLLLGLALTAHRKSIIFRREYPQLKDLVMRSQELLKDTAASFNGQSMMWRDIPGVRTLEFGAVQYEDDVRKYQGRAHDLKAFDEVSAFTEHQYRFLIGWARTTEPLQRVRVVCAGNPVGASPYDILHSHQVNVVGIQAAGASNATDRTKQFGFANQRAELWWKLRESLEPGKGQDLALPNDQELLADLCAPHYSITARGIQIESKDEIRKRLGRSTDCGDAVVMALYIKPVVYGGRWGTRR